MEKQIWIALLVLMFSCTTSKDGKDSRVREGKRTNSDFVEYIKTKFPQVDITKLIEK